ncbi:MAG TPA: hypothetical protein VMM54_08590 [Nitrospirota bacterium]|nr:hypothetical protein [Nitrospirota bacterium]
MKKLLIVSIVAGMVMVLGIGSAFAAGTGTSLKQGAFGFNVGYGNSVFGDTGVVTVSGKYFVAGDLALITGLGLQGSSGDVDADFFSISAGVRKYLKIDDFAPFLEGKLTYATEKFTGAAGNVHRDAFDVSAVFGAEYFLHRQFSIEGSIGFGIGTVDDKNANQDYTYIGTRTVGLSANFYF